MKIQCERKKVFTKSISMTLVIAMLLSIVQFSPDNGVKANALTEGYYTYTVNEGETTITDFDASVSGEIVIPNTLGGYPVTAIGNSAFSSCSGLTSITIPDSVTSIGSHAFYVCSSLTSITIPNGVTSIAQRTFAFCTSLSDVTISNSVTSIDDYAFHFCRALTDITIPNSVTSIGNYGFYDCTNLTNITIPDSVTSIGDFAFYVCSSLTSVIIPDSVTSIGTAAFDGCVSLVSITLPNSITSVRDFAFYRCSSLASITIPDSVTYIGKSAFYECSSLVSITIPGNVTSFGDYAFTRCAKLTFYCDESSAAHTYAENYDIPYKLIHQHSFDAGTVTTPATCEKSGIKTYQCLNGDCGKTKTEIIPATGHTFDAGTVTTPATCEKDGVKTYKCTNKSCVETKTEPIPALGHSYSEEWTVDRQATCTQDGSKSHHCTRCEDKKDITVIEAHGHTFDAGTVTTPATCEKDGVKTYKCTNKSCVETKTEPIPALGHSYSEEWTVDRQATCTQDGSKSHHCTRCEEKKDITVIEAHGHTFDAGTVTTPATCEKDGIKTYKCRNSGCNEAKTETMPATGHSYGEVVDDAVQTCTTNGIKSRHCTHCNSRTDITVTPATGHSYGKWIVSKEATVLAEGSQYRVCEVCRSKETEIIPKVSASESDKYGDATFTVVDAITLEPIGGANITIPTDIGEILLTTNARGQAKSILPVGDLCAQVYASGRLARNINITIKPGENAIPDIGLSSAPLVEGELKVKELTKGEIAAAGIDIDDPDNNHVYKYTVTLHFEAGYEKIDIPVTYYKNETGDFVGNETDDGGTGSGSGTTTSNLPAPIKTTIGKNKATIYPISEHFYMIVYGEVKWLKEIFDVELVVINHSGTDYLEDCVATLKIPQGLSLAPNSRQAVTEIETVPSNSQHSVHWYLRGNKEGSYSVSASLSGKIMPFGESFVYSYRANDPIMVNAPNALHMNIIAPDASFYNEVFTIRIELENVSDSPIYGIEHKVSKINQWVVERQKTVANGTSFEDSEWTQLTPDMGMQTFSADVLNPGDKLVAELSTTVLYRSALIDKQQDRELWGAIFNTVGDAIMKGLPLAAIPVKTIGMGLSVISNIDIRYYLKDVIVSELEGSTASIPYTVTLEHVPHPTIFEKTVDVVIDEVVDELLGMAIKHTLPAPIGEVLAEPGTVLLKNGYKDFTAKAVTPESKVSAYVVTDAGQTPIPAPLQAANIFTLSTDNPDAYWENGKLYFTGSADLRITANACGTGTLFVDFGDGKVGEVKLTVVEPHDCAGENWCVELEPTEEYDGYKTLYCDICDKLLDVKILKYGEYEPEPEKAEITRISGRSRYDTAIAISDEGWQSADTVILANAMNYADALAGVPYAGAIDAPVLLTAGGAELEASVLAQIEKLGAKNIVILGGKLAVSEDIETALSSNYAVERISGSSRYATSLMIAQKLNANPEQAIIVTGTGYADALSVSPYAAMEGIPILYANPATGLTEEMLAYLANAQDITIIGGEKAVTPVTVSQLSGKNITRISGRSRYLTSYEIAKEFSSFFGNDVMLATGTNFPDALAGGVLAAKLKTPLLLTDKTAVIAETQEYILSKNPNNVYILGGENAVPAKLVEDIFA